MPKNQHCRERASRAQGGARMVHTYPVYAYKRPDSDPEPTKAHLHCRQCTHEHWTETVPFGPLPACEMCGFGLTHDSFVAAEKPVLFIDKDMRNQWKEWGYITSHCRGSILRFRLLLPPRPQPSVTLSGIPEGLAMNRPYAQAVAEAWRGSYRPQAPEWKPYGEGAA